MSMKSILPSILLLALSPVLSADEAALLAKLEDSMRGEPRIQRNDDGEVIGIALNGPDLSNEDLALFNEFVSLEKLTISHAGYGGKRPKGEKLTGVDFSGVKALKDHPSLRYFSAGGAVGRPYLEGLSELKQLPELYIQTTSTVDEDWEPIGELTQLEYLGVRVRNDRMNKLTSDFLKHLMPLKNLERFLLSEMIVKDPAPLVEFVTTRPKLEVLQISRCEIPESAMEAIRKAKPELEIEVK